MTPIQARRQIEIEIHRTPTLVVTGFFEPARTQTVFTFTSAVNKEIEGPGYGGRTLLAAGCNVVAFKSSVDGWYQDVDDALIGRIDRLVQEVVGDLPRAGYGSSMGGYAAIQFSQALRLGRVLALSPQFCIRQDWDRRWASEAAHITFRRGIEPAVINADCEFFLVYDPADADRMHVDRLRPLLPRLTELRLRHAGHPVGFFLQETGTLKSFAVGALLEGRLPSQVALRRERARSPTYLTQISACCLRRRHMRAAAWAAERLIRLAPDRPQSWRRHGEVLVQMGDVPGAIAAYQRAVELAPDHAYTVSQLAVVLQKCGRIDEALAMIDRAIALDAGASGFYRSKSNWLALSGREREAVGPMRRAIALAPDRPHLRSQLANLLRKLGNLDGALVAIAEAIRLDPGVAQFHQQRATYLVARKRIVRALESAERASVLAPGNPGIEALVARLRQLRIANAPGHAGGASRLG